MTMKKTATVDEVKAAYEALQANEFSGKYGPRLVGAVDLAEYIAGRVFRTNSLAGRSRQSEARQSVDYAQLERSIGLLVEAGRFRQVSMDEARRNGLRTWGLVKAGRYYLSAEDYDRAIEAHARRARNDRRADLLESAKADVLEHHADEVDQLYRDLLLSEGLTPDVESSVYD